MCHKKQSGPKTTVTSWKKGDPDEISTPRSLTGSTGNSKSTWVWTSTSTCKMITHQTIRESTKTEQLNNNSNNLALTSHSLLDTEVKCEDISFPESPVRWISHWAESVLPTLDWFPLQPMVMCWEDVWLWNRINLSWTTPRPAYSNCQRHSGHVREDLMEVAVMSDAPISPGFLHVADRTTAHASSGLAPNGI